MLYILYMSYQQGMSYQKDMLLYVYVYDTILSLYISIFIVSRETSICSAL